MSILEFDTNFNYLPTNSNYLVSNFDSSTDFILSRDRIRIEVPKNSLMYRGGQLASGEITLKYIILEDKGDFINYNLNTLGENGLIDAHAIYIVEFYQDGELLLKNPNAEELINIYVPRKLSLAGGNSLYSLSDGGWSEYANTTLETATYNTTDNGETVTLEGIVVNNLSSNWTAVGKSLGTSDGRYEICAKLPEDHNNVNSVVYSTLEKHTSLIPLSYNTEKFIFCGEFVGVASGQGMKIIAISNRGNDDSYNFGIKSAILNSSEEINISLQSKTALEIEQELEGL